MLTFNRAEWIGRAIESIREQKFQSWELIVVHDGPNEVIPKLMNEWVARDARIRYFRRIEPGNIAEATNYGLAQARGEYIAILDDDDRWAQPEKLEKQVRFLDENKDYVVCGGGVIVVDPQGNQTLKYFKPEKDDEIKRFALLANPIAHSTAMYRREAVLQIGGYDETLPGFQDWDVWLKLGKLGKLYNFQEYFLHYSIWEGGGSFQQQKKNTHSALRIVWRHRAKYRGFVPAFGMAFAYHAYAHLPVAVKKASFSYLSRLKKNLFSKRSVQPTA